MFPFLSQLLSLDVILDVHPGLGLSFFLLHYELVMLLLSSLVPMIDCVLICYPLVLLLLIFITPEIWVIKVGSLILRVIFRIIVYFRWIIFRSVLWFINSVIRFVFGSLFLI